MTPLRRKQLVGIAGALPAFLVVGLTLHYASDLFAFVALPTDDLASRLGFALRWMLLPGICLLLGVMVAGRRGFISDAIDGTRTPASRSLEINLRYNQNTLEQTVLAGIAWAGLAMNVLDRVPDLPNGSRIRHGPHRAAHDCLICMVGMARVTRTKAPGFVRGQTAPINLLTRAVRADSTGPLPSAAMAELVYGPVRRLLSK